MACTDVEMLIDVMLCPVSSRTDWNRGVSLKLHTQSLYQPPWLGSLRLFTDT
jgi:hypothetical protein